MQQMPPQQQPQPQMTQTPQGYPMMHSGGGYAQTAGYGHPQQTQYRPAMNQRPVQYQSNVQWQQQQQQQPQQQWQTNAYGRILSFSNTSLFSTYVSQILVITTHILLMFNGLNNNNPNNGRLIKLNNKWELFPINNKPKCVVLLSNNNQQCMVIMFIMDMVVQPLDGILVLIHLNLMVIHKIHPMILRLSRHLHNNNIILNHKCIILHKVMNTLHHFNNHHRHQ
jgi:hypothetical protein